MLSPDTSNFRNQHHPEVPTALSRADQLERAVQSIEAAIKSAGGVIEPSVRSILGEFAEKVLSKYHGEDFSKVLSAAVLAGTMHGPQERRADGLPFVVHPFEVTVAFHEILGITDVGQTCSALLHDVVEDQAKRLAALSGGQMRPWPGRDGEKAEALNVLRDRYGDDVAQHVDRLTNGDFRQMVAVARAAGHVLPERFPENRFYQEHLLHLYRSEEKIDREAFAIKIADFLKNLEGLNGLRALGLNEVVERLEDKRGGLTLFFSETVGSLSEDHPLYPARFRVVERLEAAYRAMGKPGKLG